MDFQQRAECGSPDDAVTLAIGDMVRAWGGMENATLDKLASLRGSIEDRRAASGRIRPNIGTLLAEMRALVSMRDRHDRGALTEISEIETSIQRTSQFHNLVVEGYRAADGDVLLCRDARNAVRRVPVSDIRSEIAELCRITDRLATI